MGTHDLDNIQLPITYEALAPEDIKFVALQKVMKNDNKETNGRELFDVLRND
jgi:phenylalanyl-tRNA synthetase beta chain